jgi:hypothetical protein
MPTDFPSLAELVADAKRMPTSMLPQPRVDTNRVIDLTALEIRIPDSAASLVDEWEPYGS